MKRLLASFCACAFVIGLLCTMTGCPDSGKKTTAAPVKTPPTDKTKTTP